MADQQGTGKHPHKSAAEPYEHHETATTKGKGESTKGEHASSEIHSSSHAESSGEQGTGKHPHKKTSDPHEHHEGAKASK